MIHYEYRVIPSPAKGEKARGVKTPEARFARTVEAELNRMGADGWEYIRADLLPSEERSGLTGSVTNWRTLLVFRRPLTEGASARIEPSLAAPVPVEETPSDAPAAPELTADPAPGDSAAAAPDIAPAPAPQHGAPQTAEPKPAGVELLETDWDALPAEATEPTADIRRD